MQVFSHVLASAQLVWWSYDDGNYEDAKLHKLISEVRF